ncbi:hypothetical protein PFISCL1PPCAC_20829, partial [Pristionchus fissidentatus]
ASCVAKRCGIEMISLRWKGHPLCDESFARIYKISSKLVTAMKKEVLAGIVRKVHGNKWAEKNVTKTMEDKGRLMNWYREHGQFHPTTGKVVINKNIPSRFPTHQ